MAIKRRPRTLTDDRSREVRFRAARADCTRLAALAKHYGMTESALLRRLISDAARFVAKAPL